MPSPQSLTPSISIVVAVAENGVIGASGDLPWRLPDDLRRFKQLTMGHALVMGRKTHESIGRPLPGRISVVLTTQSKYDAGHDDVLVASSLSEALALVTGTEMNQQEVFVVGGAKVYRLALPRATRLYRTLVHAKPPGDVTFPEVDLNDWSLSESTEFAADDKNEFACTLQVWQRRS